MYVALIGDFRRLPITSQPTRHVRMTVCVGEAQQGGETLIVEVRENDDGSLGFEVKEFVPSRPMGDVVWSVKGRVPSQIPTSDQKIAVQPSSDDSEATRPHHYRNGGKGKCGSCGDDVENDVHDPREHPELIVGHVLNVGYYKPEGEGTWGRTQCLDCPIDRSLAPIYHRGRVS